MSLLFVMNRFCSLLSLLGVMLRYCVLKYSRYELGLSTEVIVSFWVCQGMFWQHLLISPVWQEQDQALLRSLILPNLPALAYGACSIVVACETMPCSICDPCHSM